MNVLSNYVYLWNEFIDMIDYDDYDILVVIAIYL